MHNEPLYLGNGNRARSTALQLERKRPSVMVGGASWYTSEAPSLGAGVAVSQARGKRMAGGGCLVCLWWMPMGYPGLEHRTYLECSADPNTGEVISHPN